MALTFTFRAWISAMEAHGSHDADDTTRHVTEISLNPVSDCDGIFSLGSGNQQGARVMMMMEVVAIVVAIVVFVRPILLDGGSIRSAFIDTFGQHSTVMLPCEWVSGVMLICEWGQADYVVGVTGTI